MRKVRNDQQHKLGNRWDNRPDKAMEQVHDEEPLQRGEQRRKSMVQSGSDRD